MKNTKALARAPLFWWLVSLSIVYAIVAILTEAPALLIVGNAVLAALSIGVLVAYAPAAVRAIASPKPRQGELLTLGIFIAWSGTFVARLISFIRYGLDRPDVYGTDFSTFSAFLLGLAAVCHLAAPEAVDGWLPRRTWIEAGIWLATGVFLTLVVGMLHAKMLI